MTKTYLKEIKRLNHKLNDIKFKEWEKRHNFYSEITKLQCDADYQMLETKWENENWNK